MMGKPKIRFKGYNEDWEQRKLGEVLVSLQNNTLSRADLSNETGIAKNVHYGDVLIKFGEVLDVSEEKLPMISDKSVLTKYKASFLQNGDVIVADTAEDSTVGKCSEIAGLNDEVVLSGLHTIPYRPIEKFASGYLGYYLNSSAYHKQLIPLMQGIKVTSISKSAMQNTEIVYPKSVEEQGKIGNYFQSLDHLITLHQHKCDEMKKMKKCMLQKMFPQNGKKVPEIRFEGFTNDWEQRKWIDTVDISTEMVDPSSGKYDDMPHIAPRNIESFTGRILDNVRSVKEEQLISGKFRFRPDDVVYGKINPQLRKYFYASVDGLTSADAYVFKGKNGIKQKFLFSLLQTRDFFKYSVSVSKRSGMPKINRDELNAYAFHAPSEEEQNKIGSFLLDLDHFITLHHRECVILRKMKVNDWEQRKLNEVAEFNPKSDLPESFEYVDLESVVGTEMVSHRTETKETAPSRAQRLAQTGDVFFQTVRPYQRNNYLFTKPDNNYVFSTGYAHMRPKIDAEFLMCFLQTDSFVKVVLDNCTGTSYPAINSNDLSNLEIYLPTSEDEQRRIGCFITNLDYLITLHQHKCDELQNLKKYMLQNMFV